MHSYILVPSLIVLFFGKLVHVDVEHLQCEFYRIPSRRSRIIADWFSLYRSFDCTSGWKCWIRAKSSNAYISGFRHPTVLIFGGQIRVIVPCMPSKFHAIRISHSRFISWGFAPSLCIFRVQCLKSFIFDISASSAPIEMRFGQDVQIKVLSASCEFHRNRPRRFRAMWRVVLSWQVAVFKGGKEKIGATMLHQHIFRIYRVFLET